MHHQLYQTVLVTVSYDHACHLPAALASKAALIQGYQESASGEIWTEMETRYGGWCARCAAHVAKQFHLPASEWWDFRQEAALALRDAMLAYKFGPWCGPDDFLRVLVMKMKHRFVAYMRWRQRVLRCASYGLEIDLLDERCDPLEEQLEAETRRRPAGG